MNWLNFCLLSVAYASFFAKCNNFGSFVPLKNELLFTFDLSNQTPSFHYSLVHKRNFGTTTSRMRPLNGNRLTKLVDGHETVASFPPEHVVTEVVYTPRYNPKLLAVKYLKNNTVMTRRFRKTFVWNEVTMNDYNYLMFELTQAPLEVTLDVSNLDETKFNVTDGNFGRLKLKNITTTDGYQVNRVVNGDQLLWESEQNENFSFGFISMDSTPKLLSFTVLNYDAYDVKNFTSFDGKFHEVSTYEFQFVINNFATSANDDLEVNLENLDASNVDISFTTIDGVDFVNVHPNEKFTVTKVVSGDFLLWENSKSSRCLNISFTPNKEPRLYNLLLNETNNEETKDYSLYFMKEKGEYFGLPEDQYKFKLNSFNKPSPPKENHYDLKQLMATISKEDLVTYFVPSGVEKVDRVTYGSDLVWTSTDGEKLAKLFLFKNGKKYLLQLSLYDKNNRFTNRYFAHSYTYFDVVEKSLDKKTDKLFDGWLWLSTPDFFKNVAHVQLIKTFLSLDALRDPDLGSFEFKQSKFGNVAARTFVPLPSLTLSSLLYKDTPLWETSINEELVGFVFYGSHKDLYNGSDKVGTMSNYKLAELFVKKYNKVNRNHYVLEVSGLNKTWKKVTETVFNGLYEKL